MTEQDDSAGQWPSRSVQRRVIAQGGEVIEGAWAIRPMPEGWVAQNDTTGTGVGWFTGKAGAHSAMRILVIRDEQINALEAQLRAAETELGHVVSQWNECAWKLRAAEQERDNLRADLRRVDGKWAAQETRAEQAEQVIGTLLEALEDAEDRFSASSTIGPASRRLAAAVRAALATARAAGYGTPVADAILAAQEEGPGGANRLGAD